MTAQAAWALLRRRLEGLRPALRGLLWQLPLVLAVLLAVQAWQTRAVAARLDLNLPLTVLLPQHAAGASAMSLAQWMAQHPGRPVALYVWADWCPICKLQQDTVSALLAAGVPVLSVAMRSGDAPRVQAVLRQRQLRWPTVVDADGSLAAAWGVTAVPAWLPVAADGTVHAPASGYTTEWGLRARLAWAGWLGASPPASLPGAAGGTGR